MAVLASSSVDAQDELVENLFPGVELSGNLAGPDTDLYVSTSSRIESNGTEYIALTYYQPYADGSRLRYVSYALLEVVAGDYRVRLDRVAVDDGSGQEFQAPFLFTVGSADLVVFSSCYRGCRYSFFRISPVFVQITLEAYVGLRVDESFSGRGDVYRFDDSGLSATFNVARSGDPSCCPSGGSLNVIYELRGDEFRISRVERIEPVAEDRQVSPDWLIVPGERIGPITASTSEAMLRAAFGSENVEAIEVHLGEGFSEAGTAVYPDDSSRRVEILWSDDSRAAPKEVRLTGESSEWRTAEGISLGSTLREIERLNGFPFRLAGFAFDYGGTITDCGRGRLAMLGCSNAGSGERQIILRLGPSAEARTLPEYRQVIGDRAFSSGHPAMQALNPSVYQMTVRLLPRAE